MTGSDSNLWTPRLAGESDVPRLNLLIPVAARALEGVYYSASQLDIAIGPIFGVDGQLIRDGTYYVVEKGSELIGCGNILNNQANA